MNYYLAIDIGALSGRHVLGWSKNGILQTQEIYRFSNAPQMYGGHLKWNTERLVEEIVNVIPDEILKGLADLWNLTPLDGVLKV